MKRDPFRRDRIVDTLVLAAAHIALPSASQAQTTGWKPDKTVEIVVPAASGGGSARLGSSGAQQTLSLIRSLQDCADIRELTEILSGPMIVYKLDK